MTNTKEVLKFTYDSKDIYNKIQKLKTRKAAGIDKISGDILKAMGWI